MSRLLTSTPLVLLALLAGCNEPVIDASSVAECRASIKAVTGSLPDVARDGIPDAFAREAMRYTLRDGALAAAGGPEASDDELLMAGCRRYEGLTGRGVLASR